MGDESTPTPPQKRRLRRALLFGALLAVALGVSYWDPFYEVPTVEVSMAPVPAGAVRVLTLNVAHGRGTRFNQLLTRTKHIHRNLDAIAKLIRISDADVVCLQELDAPSSWSGGFDHLGYLAEKTGYAHTWHGLHLDRRTPRLAYGTGILSRHPISGGVSQAFNQNKLDTKGFVWARIHAPQLEFSLVSLHLDFKRDGERSAQLRVVSEFLEDKPGPLVVAGDFNSAVVDANGVLSTFVARNTLSSVGGSLPTFPSRTPSKRLDDVFVSPDLEPLTKSSLDVEVSDHLPLVLEFRRKVL